MPKQRATKRGRPQAFSKPVPVTIQPDIKPETPTYYINFASVAHTEFDFLLSVIRIAPQFTLDQIASAEAGKPIMIEPLLQLIIPPRLIEGLIAALTTQKEKYEQKCGQIRKETKISKQ